MTLDKALSTARWHLNKDISDKWQRPETIWFQAKNGQWLSATPWYPGKPAKYWDCAAFVKEFS